MFLAIQTVMVGVGVSVALRNYAGFQRSGLEAIARDILIDPTRIPNETLSYTNPFFVFSADRNLLYSNRGRGRSIPESDHNDSEVRRV